MYRKFLLWILILSLTATSLAVGSGSSSADTSSLAFSSVNDVRSTAGLPELAWDQELEAKATAWSETMASNGAISHSNLRDGISQPWSSLGENVGVGGSLEAVVVALIASAPHYENMIDPRFDHLGVGVFFDGSRYWVTQSFLQSAPRTPVPTRPPTTVSPPPVTTIEIPTTIPITEPPPTEPPTTSTIPETTTTVLEPTTTTIPPIEERIVAVVERIAMKMLKWIRHLF